MHVFVIYAHPSETSFTRHVRDAFIEGLIAGGHSFELSDLYAMQFRTDITEEEYLREAYFDLSKPLGDDVLCEQEKINRSDVLAFIYPLFWTEAPAKLIGWFDRVWTYGFAYGDRTMKQLEKTLFLCVTGHTIDHLKEYGHYESMRTVMLNDRIFDRAHEKEMIVLDGTTRFNDELRKANWDKHLKTAFESGKSI
jgi:NAD(P)H dehydrogenase (quinone)